MIIVYNGLYCTCLNHLKMLMTGELVQMAPKKLPTKSSKIRVPSWERHRENMFSKHHASITRDPPPGIVSPHRPATGINLLVSIHDMATWRQNVKVYVKNKRCYSTNLLS